MNPPGMQNEFEKVNMARPPFEYCSRLATDCLYVVLVSPITDCAITRFLI